MMQCHVTKDLKIITLITHELCQLGSSQGCHSLLIQNTVTSLKLLYAPYKIVLVKKEIFKQPKTKAAKKDQRKVSLWSFWVVSCFGVSCVTSSNVLKHYPSFEDFLYSKSFQTLSVSFSTFISFFYFKHFFAAFLFFFCYSLPFLHCTSFFYHDSGR